MQADVVPLAPFDAAQLISAIRLRVSAEGEPIAIRVSRTIAGVRIEARGNVREVALGDLTGPAAARLVALAADDLLLGDLAVAPLSSPATVVSSTPRARASIGLLGSAAAWQYALGGLGLDVSFQRDRWVLALDAAGATLVDGPVRLTAAVVRVSGGARFGALEARGGALLAPVMVSNGAQDRTVLAGGSLSVRLRAPVTAGVQAVIAGGVDVFATRTTYLLQSMPALVTPRSAPWIAAGVEISP